LVALAVVRRIRQFEAMFLRSFRATRLPLQAWPQRSLFSTQQAASVPPVAEAVSSGSKKTKLSESDALITVKKGNVKQSPLRMKFLVMLIRDLWVPDALAQLKFSPKHKALDLANMVKVSWALRAPRQYGIWHMAVCWEGGRTRWGRVSAWH
jgi:hypothetical protein